MKGRHEETEAVYAEKAACDAAFCLTLEYLLCEMYITERIVQGHKEVYPRMFVVVCKSQTRYNNQPNRNA